MKNFFYGHYYYGLREHGRSQALKISEFRGCWVLKNCAIITSTNTTHYIHFKHFKREICERFSLF